MFKTVFAADIGSKCIKCVARGQVAAEETAIALEAGAKLTVAAAGNAALLHRSGVIRPVRDGAAANTRMLALLLGVLCTIGYMLWLGRCFLNDCKANLPGEDYQRIAAEFGFIWFWNPGRREQWHYVAEESGETGAALLRIWRGNMVLVIVSLAVMAVLVWMG